MEMSTILSDSFGAALSLFEDVRPQLTAADVFRDHPESLQLWWDELGRLRLWASNIGAHQRGRSSLDFRLRDASNIRDQIHRLLNSLCEAVRDVKEVLDWIDQDRDTTSVVSEDYFNDNHEAELWQVHQTITTCIDCLFQMSLLVRKPARHDVVRATIPEEILALQPWYKDHVRNKFPTIQGEVVDRLALAMVRRRHYLAYRERHRAKLGSGLERVDAADESASYQLSTTVVSQDFKFRSPDESRSEADTETSFASTMLTSSDISMPPLPAEGEDGKPFECPYCYVVISANTTHAWRKHVFEDLQPYVCTVPDCPTPATLFSSSRAWSRHLQESHQQRWYTCKNEGQLDEVLECAICGDAGESQAQLIRHMSKHLQEIALFVLPRPETSQVISDESSRGSGGDEQEEDNDTDEMSGLDTQDVTKRKASGGDSSKMASEGPRQNKESFSHRETGAAKVWKSDESHKTGLWTCCQCKDGPKVVEMICTMCGHRKCMSCKGIV